MPRIEKVSSCPLVQCQKTGLWLPDRSQSNGILGLKRRRFVQLAGIGAIGLTGSLAFNAASPKKSEAGVGTLISVVLAALQATDIVVNWADKLDLLAFLRNEEEEDKEGDVGVELIASDNGQIYNNVQFVSNVPARTEDVYRIRELDPGPPGQNRAIVETAYNSRRVQYTCSS